MITKQLNKICKVLVHTKLLPDTFTCKLLYYRKFKKWPNLNNPQDINEKMMWLLFNSDTSEWTNLADKYKVKSDKVPHPVAVRYGFENYVEGDVYCDGLPLGSFRSDNW